MSKYVSKGAVIRGPYRYRLWREWRGFASDENWNWLTNERGEVAVDGAGKPLGEPKSCVFIMLNPSTADAEKDDPTIRRCVAYAKAWGYDRLDVVNLFAYRATDPKTVLAMTRDDDPIGPDNQEIIEDVTMNAGKVICAWGTHGKHIGQDETVLGWIWPETTTYALKRTKDGSPSHPLYLPKNLAPFEWNGRGIHR